MHKLKERISWTKYMKHKKTKNRNAQEYRRIKVHNSGKHKNTKEYTQGYTVKKH